MVRFGRNKLGCCGTVRKYKNTLKAYGGVDGQCPYMGHAIASSVCLPKEHFETAWNTPQGRQQTRTNRHRYCTLLVKNQFLDWNMAIFLVTLILAPQSIVRIIFTACLVNLLKA